MSTITRAHVCDVISYGENVKEFILKLDDYETFEPGQFLQLTLDKISASDNWPESRPFSIASYLNQAHTIRLIIKKKGTYTAKIFNNLIKGSHCYVKYAYGDFLLPSFDDEPIHCIAGGTGVAPFLGFMEYYMNQREIDKLFIYYSVSKKHDFVHFNSIQKNLSPNNIDFFCTKENMEGTKYRRMLINDILYKVKNISEEHFYICGAPEFTKYFKDELEVNGALNIYLDEW